MLRGTSSSAKPPTSRARLMNSRWSPRQTPEHLPPRWQAHKDRQS